MMNVEDFRIMFRAHLSHELWDKWRNGQLDVSMRRMGLRCRIRAANPWRRYSSYRGEDGWPRA